MRWRAAAVGSIVLIVLSVALHFLAQRQFQRSTELLADFSAVEDAVTLAITVADVASTDPGAARAVQALSEVQPEMQRLADAGSGSAGGPGLDNFLRDLRAVRAQLIEPQTFSTEGATALRESMRQLDAKGKGIDIAISNDVLEQSVRLDVSSLLAYGLSVLFLIVALMRARRVDIARVLSQKQLQVSEENYRSMFVGLDEAVLHFDGEGRLTAGNPSAERLLGMSLAEMQKTNLSDWKALDSDGRPMRVDQLPVSIALKEGRALHNVMIGNIDRQGATKWFNVNVQPLRDDPSPRNRGAVVSMNDITERINATAELDHYRDRLEELVAERTRELTEALEARDATEAFAQAMSDQQPSMLAYVDKELRVLFANRAYLEWFGKSREEIVGALATDLFGVGVLQRRGASIKRVLSGESVEIADEMIGAQGQIGRFWTHRLPHVRDNEVCGYFFIATEVTELWQSQQRQHELNAALQQAEELTHMVADNIPGRVAYWDRQMRCRFVNKVSCDWFGVTREQLIGRTILEAFGQEHFDRVKPRVESVLLGETQVFERDEVSFDGKAARSQVHYVPDTRGGEVRGFFVLGLDVTQNIQTAQTIERLNTELVVARDRAEAATMAKSAFLANMSHEIRTPMNAIIGLTHLMRREDPTPTAEDRLVRVSDAANHLLDIINNILDLSRIESGQLVLEQTDFKLDALLTRSCADVVDEGRGKGLEVAIDVGGVPNRLRGDPARLAQALANLLSNAVKFTERGRVCLTGSVVESDGDGLLVRFDVSDTGIGIEANRLDQVFTAFEQIDTSTTRRFGGTGLGMGITRRLARLMGGDAGAHSEPQVGSTFWITARIEMQPSRGLAMTERLLADLRTLVVDDQKRSGEQMAAMVRTLGLRADTAMSGPQALDLVRAAQADGDPYAVILVERAMPHMDGFETTRRVLEQAEDEPPTCILLCHSSDSVLRDQALELGISSLLQKPITLSTLHDHLVDALVGVETAPSTGSELNLLTELALRANHEGARVLVAEDNPVNQEVAVMLLRLAGLQVDLASTGRQAVAMASDTAYDLILMDIQMPEMDGLAASRQLRSMPGTAQTPIIAMTANAYAEDRAACIAAGMNDYVTKPVDPPILYDVLAHWLPRPGAHKNAPSAQAVAAQMEALVRPSMNEPAPGLNLGRGLAFFANNADVYRRVLGQFADLYEAGISAVTQWLSAPSSSLHDSVRRELHSLGGASSAVGAEEIGKRAANISHEFRENPATDELAPQVTALMNDLSGLIAGIRRHLESTVANQK